MVAGNLLPYQSECKMRLIKMSRHREWRKQVGIGGAGAQDCYEYIQSVPLTIVDA